MGELNHLPVLIGKLDIREPLSNTLIHRLTFLIKLAFHLSESAIALLGVSFCHFGEETFPFQLLEQAQIHELLRFSVFGIG